MASSNSTVTVAEIVHPIHEQDSGEMLNEECFNCVEAKETFWTLNISRYNPTMFYHQQRNGVSRIINESSDLQMKSQTLKLPQMKLNVPLECNEIFMPACFIAFLARINCTSAVHVGIIASKDIACDHRSLYPNIIPGIFTVDLNTDVKSNIIDCVKALKICLSSGTFMTDMCKKYSELGQKMVHHNVVIGKKPIPENDICDVLYDCNLVVLFNDSCSELDIVYDDSQTHDYRYVINGLKHFPTFLKEIHKSHDAEKLKDIQLVLKGDIVQFYCSLPSEDAQSGPNGGLLHLVEQQCKLTPLNIAIKTIKHEFTYCKLHDEITCLYNALNNVIPYDHMNKPIIAVHLPKSIAYIVSILSTVRSHCAFLPLPIDYPYQRLHYTIQDAKVKQIITTSKIIEEPYFKSLTSCMEVALTYEIAGESIVIVNLTPSNHAIQTQFRATNSELLDDFAPHRRKYSEEDFCYVLYTSGSTGRPKGVKIKETSVINMAKAQIKIWDLSPDETIAQFASIGFDATISEIFTSLLSGATLAILAEKEQLGSDFVNAMNNMKVSTITLPPSVLNVYSPTDLPTLRKVVAAGESCTLATAIKWNAWEGSRFFNAYGPTEATVCATCFEYTGNPRKNYMDDNQELPIGYAIDGVCVYLFDEFMNPVPSDIVGELYIGGKGLAYGYIGHASDFTNERFIQNPLESERCILYKTGDLGFRDCDGTITYVGRTDYQLKIRGQRVELREVEQVLLQHPKVEMAVVVSHICSYREDLSIAAFVAPTLVCISELKMYLRKVLPEYMVPMYVKKLEVAEFPKTLNGKLNRKQLETDESIHEQMLNVHGHSQMNETQLLVARHWCKVFKFKESFMHNIHGQSSFRALGGNSLLLVLLHRHIKEDTGNTLLFIDFGMADTIEEFAEAICRSRDQASNSKATDLQADEELRQLILHDSELGSSFFTHCDTARRRPNQFTQNNDFVHCFPSAKHPKNILISGATGFLGAFLLSELLEKSDAQLYCMVREPSGTGSRTGRVIGNMRKYGLWKHDYTHRIDIVISDLSQNLLGIAPDMYKFLCNVIDVVFMNAATMNFNMPYNYHKHVNVEGTKRLIKICATGVPKYIFATSSLGVFLFPSENELKYGRHKYSESDFLEDPLLVEGGYGRSKWASEKLTMQALELLPGGAIFRPGRISGRCRDGVGPRNDLFASTIIGMKRLGCFPDMDFPYDLIPVDYCASAMVEIALRICNSQTNDYEKVYHLYNNDTMPFCDLFCGMELKSYPLQQWREKLEKASEDNKELIPLIPFFLSRFWDRATSWPLFETTNVDKMISEDTKSLLKPARELLDIYKAFFGV